MRICFAQKKKKKGPEVVAALDDFDDGKRRKKMTSRQYSAIQKYNGLQMGPTASESENLRVIIAYLNSQNR